MSKKKCFVSFHWKPDSWRVSQIKNMGSIEEQPILEPNEWEKIKNKGDDAIKKWIADNMADKKCLIVLVGTQTAGRPWVKYEIKEAWKKGLGLIAVHIHNLKDKDGKQSAKGMNPFESLNVDGKKVVGKVYDPPFTTSTYVYDHIKDNIESWVDAAITARN